MTQDPEHLTRSPSAQVDVLSEVLRGVRLTGAVFYRVSTTNPWPAIQVPMGQSLSPAFGGRTRNVASYHVLLEGTCWTGLGDGPQVRLRPGDVVVYPRGDPYFLSCDLPPAAASEDGELVDLLKGVASGRVAPSITFGEAGERTTFVCGFLGCGPQAADPVLSGLPPLLHVSEPDERLAQLVELALAEVDRAPGGESIRERLSESMFLETLRQYLSRSSDLGWVASTTDAVVGQALVALHEDLRRSWTLSSLADAVGVSRSVLADRFTRTVGQPPMQYLGRVRLQLGARLLADSSATVAAIGRDVGYGSEAAFSHAFKRAYGVAPGAWRDARSRDW